MKKINRREVMGIAAGATVAGATLLSGCTESNKRNKMGKAKHQQYKNEDFYKADGSFDTPKAKQAYYEMMEYFNYPIPDRLRGEDFWSVDFGLGRFTEVGMAGILWINEQEDNYMGHEIFLLPGQRIPEHGHDKTDPHVESTAHFFFRYPPGTNQFENIRFNPGGCIDMGFHSSAGIRPGQVLRQTSTGDVRHASHRRSLINQCTYRRSIETGGDQQFFD